MCHLGLYSLRHASMMRQACAIVTNQRSLSVLFTPKDASLLPVAMRRQW